MPFENSKTLGWGRGAEGWRFCSCYLRCNKVVFKERPAAESLRLLECLPDDRTSQTMAWWLFEDDPLKWGRWCRECGFYDEWYNYYAERKGRNGRDSICKPCKISNVTWCWRYRQRHVAPPSCQGCGRAGRVEVDHDHDLPLNDGAFRSWLCRTCNRTNRRWIRVHESK